MEENFKLLLDRVIDTLDKSDLLAIDEQLKSIKGNTVLVGAGGSSVVATFASKVLDIDNIKSSRDLNYMNLDNIDNIIVFSYSGKGYVLESLFDKNKKIYLFTNGDSRYDNVENIKYDTSIKKEKSFISLASTLMPMAIIYKHYKSDISLEEFKKIIIDMFSRTKDIDIKDNNVYEVLSGYDSMTASKYLELTMIESGIAIPIIHDKYDYCHGRSTLSYKNDNALIMFDSEKELDKLFLECLNEYYSEIINVKKFVHDDSIIDNDFYFTLYSMYLTKKIAENKNLDLSNVDYSPVVKKLYRYKNEM